MRATDVYRALLWCYPAEFRDEYGREMVGAFADQLRDARHGAGWRATAVIWFTTLVDLVPTAFREHRHVIQQDLRHAVRVFAATPGFTAVAVLSLALGIGANVAIFSLLNSVLLSALPVPHPKTLVVLTDPTVAGVSQGQEDGDRSLLTYPEFVALQQNPSGLQSVMAAQSRADRLDVRIGGGEPEEVSIRLVSSSFFTTLGVPAFVGRTFDAVSEPAPGTAPYAVLSHDFWQRRFGGRADVIGQPINIRGTVFTVLGVEPSSFFGETVGEQPDLWVPLAMQGAVLPGRDWLHDTPGSFEKVMWLHVFGRLAQGATIEQVQAHANVTFQQGLANYYAPLADATMRKRFMDQRLVVRPASTGASTLRGDFSEPLLVLLGAAGFVLLIACSNLGNLLLARTTARSREMAVRLALGASRGRLIRQLLTESLSLAMLGGVCGVGTAVLLRRGLLRLVSDTVSLPASLDLRELGFIFAVTLTAGLLLGLLPALRLTKADVNTGLREEGRGIAGSAAWLRIGRIVVVGQLALSLPLLVGAGLLVRTLSNLQNVDLGYARDHLLTVRIDAQAAGYEPERQSAAFDALLAGVRGLPGVRAATVSNNGLFGGSDNGDQIVVEGYKPTGQGDQGSRYDAVGPRYFSTLGIPVLVGREITDEDRAGGRQVCVINETFAKKFFRNRSPIGLHVTQQYGEEHHTYEVVGVVRDSRQNRLRGEIEHRFYTPVSQPAATIGGLSFIIRPVGENASLITSVRRLIQQMEPGMTITRSLSVSDAVQTRLVQDRLLARLSIGFGLVALLLSAIGLYGVLSYGVSRRTNEIGVRKALGAQHHALIGMIMRETGWLLIAGLVAGAALSAASIQLIASRLYGLSAADPVAVMASVGILAVVSMLATWLPARRAASVDPLVALRHE